MGRVDEQNVLRMIFGLAFMRPLLQATDTDIDLGVVVLMDSNTQARLWCQECESKVDGKIIQKLKSTKVLNYQAGVHMLKDGDNVEDIKDFLMKCEFLPTLVVSGILPFFLREDSYVFRIRNAGSISAFSEEYKAFREFVIENVGFVKKSILQYLNEENLHNSNEYSDKYSDKYPAFRVLDVIGYIWELYYANNCSEASAENFCKAYMADISEIVKGFDDYSDYCDIEEEISSLIWNFLMEHVDVVVSNVDNVSGHAYEAMKVDKAILYDEEFYYFPERLIKEIAQPLMETMAIGELKKMLKDQGIIVCNGQGYTIKKRCTTMSGYCGRMRAIKVQKTMLSFQDNLMLEDFLE